MCVEICLLGLLAAILVLAWWLLWKDPDVPSGPSDPRFKRDSESD